jgi:LAGLIDADG-like domain
MHSNELIKKIIKMYQEGKGSPTIAKEVSLTFSQVLSILKKNNIKLRTARESAKKTTFNDNFFENIDNEHKAYFLGFILADGSVSDKHPIRLKISISHKDREILDKFNAIMESDVKISSYSPKNGYSRETVLNELIFYSHKIVEDLKNLGIYPNKTSTVNPPQIDPSLEKHFWRGVLDGDGHISLYAPRKTTRKSCKMGKPCIEVGICGNILTMNKYSAYLDSLNIIHKITSDKSIFRIRISNKFSMTLLDELYKESTIYLDRKYQKYLKFKDELQKYDSVSRQQR